MPRKSRKSSDGKITKTSFVLGLPAQMSAKDVVKKAAAAGISLTDKHVYVIRSVSRTKPKKPGRGRKLKRAARSRRADGVEATLRSAIAQVGLSRAKQIFDEVAAVFAG